MVTVPEFIGYNETAFKQLLRFFDYAPERLTIAFVSVNFTPDRDTLIEAIPKDSRCQLVVLDFPDPNLQFFQEALLEKLAKEKRQPNKKLVS